MAGRFDGQKPSSATSLSERNEGQEGAPREPSGSSSCDSQVGAKDPAVGEGTDGGAPRAEGIRSYEEEGTVEQVAYRLLASYRDSGDCTLADAGYLDLLGSVWGCVVGGDGWSEVCVVWAHDGESSCTVRVLRIDSAEVRQVFGEGDGDQ